MRLFFIFILGSLINKTTLSQTEFRSAAELSLKLPGKMKISGSLEDRHTNKGFKQFQSDWELRKSIYKGIGIGSTYRIAGQPSSLITIAFKHRFGLKFKCNFLSLLSISKRMDLTLSINQQWNWKQEGRNISVLRGKLLWGFDIKDFPITPVCYLEHFYCWNENIIYSQSEIRSQPGNRTFRYIGGFKYEFNKKTQLAFIVGQDYIFRKNKFENIFSLTLKHQLN